MLKHLCSPKATDFLLLTGNFVYLAIQKRFFMLGALKTKAPRPERRGASRGTTLVECLLRHISFICFESSYGSIPDGRWWG
jgi:hypothetical protein